MIKLEHPEESEKIVVQELDRLERINEELTGLVVNRVDLEYLLKNEKNNPSSQFLVGEIIEGSKVISLEQSYLDKLKEVNASLNKLVPEKVDLERSIPPEYKKNQEWRRRVISQYTESDSFFDPERLKEPISVEDVFEKFLLIRIKNIEGEINELTQRKKRFEDYLLNLKTSQPDKK